LFTVVSTTPSLHVKLNGAVPVKVNVTFGSGVPKQTMPPPDTEAVGSGLTVTVAVPDPATVHPFVSVTKPVIEYAVVVAGVMGIGVPDT
jgi:hypothetical protein